MEQLHLLLNTNFRAPDKMILDMRHAYQILDKVKRPPERSRCRWDDNIKVDLKGIGWEGGTGERAVAGSGKVVPVFN